MKFIDNFPSGFIPRDSQKEIIQKIDDALSSGFTECVSDTQRYRQTGNAVTFDVVFNITSTLFKK